MGVNVCLMVTERIIAELEQGSIPWQKPWTGVRSGAYSYATGKPYSLLNQMILRRPGAYLTFKQVSAAGGCVRKGEKAQFVVFWKPFEVVEEDADGNPIRKTVPFLRYYHVFHIDQCDGVKEKIAPEELKPLDPIAEADAILTAYIQRSGCPIIHEKIDQAYYSPSRDQIHLPLMEQFRNVPEYYSTAFHECIHSTGHEKRLARLTKTAHFGNDEYSKEELVAEIGSAVLMNDLSIETTSSFRNSAAYIQSWLRALRDDSRLIVSAAGKAEKAVRYLLNEQPAKSMLSA